MVTVGLTIGFAEVEVNPLGLLTHEYVLPMTAAAPIDAESPTQIAVFAAAAAAGSGFTDMVTAWELVQPVAVMVSVRV